MPRPLPAFTFKVKVATVTWAWLAQLKKNWWVELQLLTLLGSFCFGSFSVFRTDKTFWGKSPQLCSTSGKDKMNDRTKDLEKELVSRLKTFGRLYDQQAENLHAASDVLERMVKSASHILRSLVVEAGQAATCLLWWLFWWNLWDHFCFGLERWPCWRRDLQLRWQHFGGCGRGSTRGCYQRRGDHLAQTRRGSRWRRRQRHGVDRKSVV